ncbi:MAG: AAA family ATPase, partial [Polyangia bacterium]
MRDRRVESRLATCLNITPGAADRSGVHSLADMDLRFVGRIREQETLRRLLVDYVVVTLHGAAGVGKSALVQSFVDAETQAGRLAPARLVSLRGLDHPRAIVAATRRALGLDDQVRGRSAAELLASLFDAPPHTIVWD